MQETKDYIIKKIRDCIFIGNREFPHYYNYVRIDECIEPHEIIDSPIIIDNIIYLIYDSHFIFSPNKIHDYLGDKGIRDSIVRSILKRSSKTLLYSYYNIEKNNNFKKAILIELKQRILNDKKIDTQDQLEIINQVLKENPNLAKEIIINTSLEITAENIIKSEDRTLFIDILNSSIDEIVEKTYIGDIYFNFGLTELSKIKECRNFAITAKKKMDNKRNILNFKNYL